MNEEKTSKASNFVGYILERSQVDNGFAARLRRADNPATEYQSWDVLAGFGVSLEMDHSRLAYQTVAAAIARAKPEANGNLTLGRALADCYEKGYEKGNDDDQAKTQLRRLLACDDVGELCRILRSQLSLIQSKVRQALDYETLLKQLLAFPYDSQRIKARWAQDFYSRRSDTQRSESGEVA